MDRGWADWWGVKAADERVAALVKAFLIRDLHG
jgi:hypothetical protein